MGVWTDGWTGGQIGDYYATSWPPTGQLKLNCIEFSCPVGADCGNRKFKPWMLSISCKFYLTIFLPKFILIQF